MQEIAPENLTPEVEEALIEYLYNVLDNSFQRDYYDYNMFRLNCALKQKTVHQAYSDGEAREYGLTKEYLERMDNTEYEEIRQTDEFSSLTSPIMLKGFRALRANVGNIVFPLNGKSVGIKRDYAEFFDNNSINDFLPQGDECWNSILECENRNYGHKAVYDSILDEGLAHGVFAMDHEFDPLTQVVEPVAPGIRNIGMYPLQADWRKSNRCYYVDVNYNQLLGRSDLNQEILEQIKPKETDDYYSGGDRDSAHENPGSIPFGKVRVVKFYCPSVYVEYERETYIAEGLKAIALINPMFKEGNTESKKLYLLKLETNIPIDRHGLLLGTPVVNQPNEFFNQGLFYPWLSHQKVANGFYSAVIRLASYLTQGPFNEEKSGYSVLDSKDEDLLNGFLPYQVLKGKKYTPVFSAEFVNFIQIGQNAIAQLEADILSGIGVDRPTLGVVNNGNNLKDEVLKAQGSGDLRVLEYAVRFNEVYIASLFTKVRTYQSLLREQVIERLGEVKNLLIAEGTPVEITPPDDQIIEQILEENQLFKRLLNQSGLKQKYREFYKIRQKEILENEAIMLQLQIAEQEVVALKQFSMSPINWSQYPPAPVMPEVDPTTGATRMVTLTADQEKERRAAWEANEAKRRQEAGQEASMKLLDVKKKELSLKPIEVIPPPSNLLLFNILIAPVEESNIQIPGVMEAILKTVRDEDLARLGQILNTMPEDEMAKIDFHKLFILATRGKSVTVDMIMKDQATITREEQARDQQAQLQQQVMMEMSKNPGAQPPQIGKGNRA